MFGALAPRQRGFTLIELLVALGVMAVIALLSWRGMDGMVRVHTEMRQRADGVVALQTGLTQWSTDLDALIETQQFAALDFDGKVLRMTRRDTTAADSPVRVVAWATQPSAAQEGPRNSWARWQSPPLRTRAELQDAWDQAQRWAHNPGEAEKQRQVALFGIEHWEVFYHRGGAWSNPMSSAVPAPGAGPAAGNSGAPAGVDLAPVPDGVRLILSVSPGQALAGVFTKDWIRPVTGGGKS